MPTPKTHNFTHEAMKTVFQLRLNSDDAALAKNAALDCFERLDAIEASLSRYIPGSDVWQINHLQTGESLFVSEDCYQCLVLAMRVGQATDGLFDVTLGRWIEHRKTAADTARPALEGQLLVDDARPQIHCIERGREIDLGGIGKGYALDVMAVLCRDWGIAGGLLSAGASTQLAYGSVAWPVTLRGDHHRHQVELQNSALSASGTAIQGSHIVASSGSEAQYPRSRAWVHAASAAMADAFSTAALLAEDPASFQKSGLEHVVFTEGKNGIQPT